MKRLVTLMVCAALALPLLFAVTTVDAQDDKPRIAVLEFKNKADNQWWYKGGAEAMQDVFVTELVKSGKFRVIDREQLAAMMREKNLSLSGDIDTATAVQAGKLIGVNYLLTGAVTEYGETDAGGGGWRLSIKKKTFVAAANARLINAETGEIVWADEARGEESSTNVRVHGYGGGVDDDRMFDKVMKPVVQELVSSLKVADI